MMLSRKHHWYINACLCLDSVTSHREVRVLLLLLDGLGVGLQEINKNKNNTNYSNTSETYVKCRQIVACSRYCELLHTYPYLLGTKGTAKSTSALGAKVGGYELLLAEEST
jgi:hypothetical protein